jgi:MFS family permease
MQVVLQPDTCAEESASGWRHPSAWLRNQRLSPNFWVFFSAAFFFDAGFSVYFFLFNLYLLDFHFSDRSIGLIGGALTLGSLVGTLPAGFLAGKFGLRPLLAICFASASLLNALRTLWMWEAAQVVLAFLAGVAMCMWGVCFLPAVARLTNEKTRTSAFSLIFSVSIGTSILGGIVSGYLPLWFKAAGIALQAAEIMRLILLAACGIAFVSIVPLLYLRFPAQSQEEADVVPRTSKRWFHVLSHDPFLVRFLPLMALWAAVLAAFTPFANVYLSRELHIPLARIGLIFSATQALQFAMGLLVPVIVRALGLIHGIVATQLIAALALIAMAVSGNGSLAIALYLLFSAAQWASSPVLYNLLMNKTPDQHRSTAAAMALFSNAFAATFATSGAGSLFTRFGYKPVLLGIAGLALVAAMLFRILISPHRSVTSAAIAVACLEDGSK